MGLFVRKMDKVENLEYLLAKFDLNLSIISQDIDIERISFVPILPLIKASNSAES